MPSTWHSSLAFAKRLEAVTRIKNACKVDGHSCDATANHHTAVQLEEGAYRTAESLIEYEHTIHAHVTRLEEVPASSEALARAQDDLQVDLLMADGITIGRYTNAQHFKDGLTATIFKARAPAATMNTIDLKGSPNRIVALKVISLPAVQPPHSAEREVRFLARLDHENVIALLESFKDGNRLVMVLPFMPLDIAEHIRKAGMSISRRKRCIADVLRGLAFIHSHGIIHRDIKPSNILLKTPSGPSYIADFGIAWSADDPASERWDQKILDVGTTCYRPPELLFGNQKYDTSLDLWAVGCVIAQICGLGTKTLFESGELGSDLALVKSIFETLGTPDEQSWPEVVTFPDWGKMAFHKYPAKSWEQILPNANEQARDLVASLVQYESKQRLGANLALKHPYLVL